MQATTTMKIDGMPTAHALTRAGLALLLAMALLFGGCANMTETQQRTGKGAVGGAAIGAAAGAIFGAMAGVPGTGAAIGAAVGTAAGATGGYIYDQHKKKDAVESENQRLRWENEKMRQEQAR